MIDTVMQHLMVVWVVVLTPVEHLMEILRQPFQMSFEDLFGDFMGGGNSRSGNSTKSKSRVQI